MVSARRDLKSALSHVVWIGGPPDGGKTSIAALLARKYGLQVYHFDRHEPAHFARCDPVRHPALYAAHPERMTPEQRWLGSSPEEMARETIASWTERFGMAVEDLLAMPDDPPIVAEGPGFFPEAIASLLSGPDQAVWLIPSEEFKRACAIRRGKPGDRHLTSDPERATENVIRRDFFMARHIRQRASELGLTVYDVDGTREVDEMAALVESHFASRLRPGRMVPGRDAPA